MVKSFSAKAIFVIFLMLCSIGRSSHVFAQGNEFANIKALLDKQKQSYKAGKMLDKDYVQATDSLIWHCISKKYYFEREDLEKRLEVFKEIVWNNKKFEEHRHNSYYQYFKFNAYIQHKPGEEIYYAEQIGKEKNKIGSGSMLAAIVKGKIFIDNKNFPQVIELYKTHLPYIESLILESKKTDIGIELAEEALYLSSITCQAYAVTKNTTAIADVLKRSQQLFINIRYKDSSSTFVSNSFILTMQIHHASAQSEYIKQRQLFQQGDQLIADFAKKHPSLVYDTDPFSLLLVRLKIDYYFEVKNNDSLEHYIKRFDEFPLFPTTKLIATNLYNSKLLANQNKYQDAYYTLLKVKDGLETRIGEQTKEMVDLTYAYTVAEINKKKLLEAEHEKQRRTYWIVAISTLAVIAILVIYFAWIKAKRKAQKGIDTINNMANMQIALLEETKLKAKQEEQERLGQELHDGFTANIAVAKHRIDLMEMKETDESIKKELVQLSGIVAKIYDTARDKSHRMYEQNKLIQAESFEVQISQLLASALPSEHYKTDVEISTEASVVLTFEQRIELIRILQEAVTNVVKHAKASEVSVFLFKENTNTLCLQISDNGKGFDKKNSKPKSGGMGLQSIQKRVDEIGGTIDIIDEEGTTISVSFPVT